PQYWGEERVYHPTAPISMIYALREALRLVAEEGLEARFARHGKNHEALAAGLGALGLALATEEGHRLPMLNAVTVPDGVDEARVRTRLLAEHGIEIGGGLGPMKGKVWRIGLMGESSRRAHVLTVLAALEDAFRAEGRRVAPGAALAAAQSVYAARGGQAGWRPAASASPAAPWLTRCPRRRASRPMLRPSGSSSTLLPRSPR